MKNFILLLTLTLLFSKSYSQIGWNDENEETIPDHFVKYDTIPLYLFDTSKKTIKQGLKIVRYTHHFPAITIQRAPVYWTIYWWIVDKSFKRIEGEYTLLTVLK